MTGALGGRSRNDAVEVGRVALRHDHRLAASGGAADEVRMRGRPAVVCFDDLFREHGDARVRDVLEIESGLLILLEAAVEGSAGAGMAGVGGGNCKSANQCGLGALELTAGRLGYGAVETAAAHLQ